MEHSKQSIYFFFLSFLSSNIFPPIVAFANTAPAVVCLPSFPARCQFLECQTLTDGSTAAQIQRKQNPPPSFLLRPFLSFFPTSDGRVVLLVADERTIQLRLSSAFSIVLLLPLPFFRFFTHLFRPFSFYAASSQRVES